MGKARSLKIEWSPIRGSTLVGYGLTHTGSRVEVNGPGKHSGLFVIGHSKSVIIFAPWACIIKLFTAVIIAAT